MGRLRILVAAIAVAVTVLAGSSDPDGWGSGGSGAEPAQAPAVDVLGPVTEHRPVGRRWASTRVEGRRWVASLEPHGRHRPAG